MLDEEEKLKNNDAALPVKVVGFRKVYPALFRKGTVAVERTSFGLDYGECFALLGVKQEDQSSFKERVFPRNLRTFVQTSVTVLSMMMD